MSRQLHIIKSWPGPFAVMWNGEKTWELRQDDRNYKTGDSLVIREWDPSSGVYSGRVITGEVGYRLTPGAFPGLLAGFVIFSVNNRANYENK